MSAVPNKDTPGPAIYDSTIPGQAQVGYGPGAPPPPGYGAPPPVYGPGATTVIIQPSAEQIHAGTVQHSSVAFYSEQPTTVLCRHCQQTTVTTVSTGYSDKAWTYAAILLAIGCWLGCCVIPFFVVRDHVHRCGNCGKEVGRMFYK
ncbi:hypothetical protein BaRGS_00029002 [Batillaria attramentaria]|uniref:LITAF domain-containing protein n=1 Tax=Batillaria attramentaria TaxID=370345 RepID=A0ABD0JYB1_9CAEN